MKSVKFITLSLIPILASFLSVFLVTDIPFSSLVIGFIFLSISLFIPGLIVGYNLLPKNFQNSEKLILGITIISSFALLIYPIFAKIGLAKFTWLVILVFSLIIYFSSRKNFSFSVNNNFIYFLISVPFSIWVGRQANVVPILNFDQFSIPPDIYHHLSLASEIGNHGPEIFPYVAGSLVPLQYHWGAFSLGSFLNAAGLISLPVAMYRIEFILLSFLLLFLLFFTGKYLGKCITAGIVSVSFGLLTLYPSFNVVDGLQVPLIRTGSISQLAASVFFVAGLRIFFEIVNNKETKITFYLILSILLMSTTLSKGPTGLLLLGVISLTGLYLVFKKQIKSALKLVLSQFASFIIILPLIFTFGPTKSSGMSLWFSPTGTIKTIIESYGESVNTLNLFKAGIILFASVTSYLLIIFLNSTKKSVYFLPILFNILIGTLGLFILEAWGNSQWFIYYPVGILVALLLAELTPNILNKFKNTEIILYIFIGAVLQNSIFLLLRNWFEPNTINLGILWVLSIIFIGIASFAISIKFWKNSFYISLNAAALSILFVGFFSSLEYKDIYPYPVSKYEHPWSITIGTANVAKYIKNNSSVDDVLITNRHCVGPEEKNTCIARVFSLTALSERRTFIEGWAYTTCPLREALNNEFWDQPLLKINQNVVENNDLESTKKVTEYGVRWIVIDERRPHSKNLDQIAQKQFESGQVEVWKIKPELISYEKPKYTGCKSA